MNKQTSIVHDYSETEQNIESESTILKHSNRRRRSDVRIAQNVLLIWLDGNIDEQNDNDYRNTIKQLRRVVNKINTFTDVNQCAEFITNIEDEKACMIVSGSLAQHIVPIIHEISQLDSMFIFCDNQKKHDQWAKEEWPKFKGIFTELSQLCEAVQQAVHQCERNAVSISFVPTNAVACNKTLDQLDSSFMYTQILKEILLIIKFEAQHIKQYIDYCREQFASNDHDLYNLEKFDREYCNRTPIWWYTSEYFLYSMLNHALRTLNVDIIVTKYESAALPLVGH